MGESFRPVSIAPPYSSRPGVFAPALHPLPPRGPAPLHPHKPPFQRAHTLFHSLEERKSKGPHLSNFVFGRMIGPDAGFRAPRALLATGLPSLAILGQLLLLSHNPLSPYAPRVGRHFRRPPPTVVVVWRLVVSARTLLGPDHSRRSHSNPTRPSSHPRPAHRAALTASLRFVPRLRTAPPSLEPYLSDLSTRTRLPGRRARQTTNMTRFGDFRPLCHEVPSYPWCNLFFRQLLHINGGSEALTGASPP